ncbi:MAG: CatB-related O-acetyltransferase [Candidatus Falkowbacteria bacterium]
MIKKILPNIILKYCYSRYSRIKNVKYEKEKNGRFIPPIILYNNVLFYGKSTFETGIKVNGSAQFTNVNMGKYSYLAGESYLFNCSVGRFCSIGQGVTIGLFSHPVREFVSTHPAFYSVSGQSQAVFADKNIFSESIKTTVGNDVWIGQNALIKSGVTIGDGAIIGAGAVVVKDVMPYEIVGGVPAKSIRFRFNDDDIAYLLKFKWWNKDEQWLKENWKLFSNITEFKKVQEL